MKLEPFSEETTHDEKVDQNDRACKKLKRTLEVLSIICSTVGINIVIACFYGGITNILGCKSPEVIFKCAFAFLLASVILGILAMASSWFKDRNLQKCSVSATKTSWLYLFFASVCNNKNKSTEDFKKASDVFSPEPKVNQFACVKDLKRNENIQMPCNLPNLPRDSPKDNESSTETARLSTAQSLRKTQPSVTKTHPQLQRHAPFIFGQCSVTQNSTGFTQSSKFMLFDTEQKGKTSCLVPFMQENFTARGNINEGTFPVRVNPRNTYKKKPQPRIVIPRRVGNTYILYPSSDSKAFPPSMDTFNIFPEHPRKMFNQAPHIRQQKSHRNVHNIPNTHLKEESNTFHGSFPSSGKTSQNAPNDIREIFDKRIQTVQQNLHEIRSTYFNEDINCLINNNFRSCPETFQITPENQKEIPDQSRNIRQRNLHKIRDSGQYNYSSGRRFASNMEVFQNRAEITKKMFAPKLQIGIIHHYDVRKASSEEGCVNLQERPVSPMEIDDKLPNDQVLEVSSKLKDMNFLF